MILAADVPHKTIRPRLDWKRHKQFASRSFDEEASEAEVANMRDVAGAVTRPGRSTHQMWPGGASFVIPSKGERPFARWFDSDTAGPPEHYKEIASEVWRFGNLGRDISLTDSSPD
jgi:hypothetical protein